MTDLTVVVPTRNEAPSIPSLITRIARAVDGIDAEILFVDDSDDGTDGLIRTLAEDAPLPIRLIHRTDGVGGLSGAVVEGLTAAHADLCVVMDGDLQHPPETIADLLRAHRRGDVDVVVASRYAQGGQADGLADVVRSAVSRVTTALTRAMFPLRLRECTDPMTGFFLIDRTRVDLAALRPRGFKILLEILARNPLRLREVPFDFAERHEGSSKASVRQGLHFVTQLATLRFGKMSGFALIGAFGAVANLAIMAGLTHIGVSYVWAAIAAAEATIIGNFVLQERFVFRDMTGSASGGWLRFAKSFTFNNAEALIRIPVLALLVETWHISSVLAAAITLAVAFVARFAFHSLVVYA
ncbi:MAG: glycosyl transferase family 2, partial [Microbacterium sp.]|uniref:glycosyltransferase n=2 Tax=unclassified Microbacterium TaxID=2609290 RepID=UPI000DB331B5